MKGNRLQNEKSPYLLQHAQNPVDWYPWGDEAFARARLEDKPVFLSIGYSTCHWCHVMERESFEDENVARLLNETFVNVKVDREERPDIDAVYMKVCQMMTQSGGWPLTIMMTPDQKPFFAATYLSPISKYGRAGLTEIIRQVRILWQTKRVELRSAAAEITSALQKTPAGKTMDVGEEALHRAYRSFSVSFDQAFGGFGQAPKFPLPHQFFFLLRYWKRTGEPKALQMVECTVQNMRRGGIFDQIGFGFHRYSTDERWIVPHFEKMLYDQALMALACAELYQATGREEYATVTREIVAYVLRDMTDAGGGFYCAEDADSEGVEGKFYLWTEKEIRSALGGKEADFFLANYRHDSDRSAPGMQEIPDGQFIPHLKPSTEIGGPERAAAWTEPMDEVRRKLLALREKRVRPRRDDKILTDWNGLMIAALARCAQVLNEPALALAAGRAMDFILRSLRTPGGRLLHRFRDGQSAIAANLDDYAFIIWALLELYEATFDAAHLSRALEFQSHLTVFFRDEKDGGFFFTPKDAETLPVRPKELHDGAVPSGNSVAFQNGLRLFQITGDDALEKGARDICRVFGEQARAMPTAFAHFLCGLDFAIGPASEVIIAGRKDASDTQALLRALRRSFTPNKIVIFRPEGPGQPDIETIAPFVQSHDCIDGRATAYVCSNFTCRLPATDPEQMMALLNEK
jgi:uncharacterized protein YyaL (SSP411 family)